MAGGLMAGTDQNRSEYRALVFNEHFVIFSRAVRLSLIQFLTKTRCQPLCYYFTRSRRHDIEHRPHTSTR